MWGLGPHGGPPASREPPESPESAPATASAAESGCGGLAPTVALLHLVNLLNLLPGVPATASAARQFHFAQKSRLTFGGSFAIIIIILLPDTPAGPGPFWPRCGIFREDAKAARAWALHRSALRASLPCPALAALPFPLAVPHALARPQSAPICELPKVFRAKRRNICGFLRRRAGGPGGAGDTGAPLRGDGRNPVQTSKPPSFQTSNLPVSREGAGGRRGSPPPERPHLCVFAENARGQIYCLDRAGCFVKKWRY